MRRPAQAVRRETDVHAAVIALAVFARARCLPVGQLEAPRPARARAIVHQAGAVTAPQVPGHPRPRPAQAVGRLGVPDGGAAVVPDAIALVLLVAQDRQVRLRGAERLAVQHRARQALRRFAMACQAVEAIDQVVVQKELRPDANLQRLRRRLVFAFDRPAVHDARHAGMGRRRPGA